MRLVAIYIKEHFLFSEPQTINLGGKFLYTIIPRKGTENEYDITREENPNFIDGFWGDKISLVSAIVGENGTGKTSVLKIINNSYLETSKYALIYEDKGKYYIQNRTGNKDENENIIKDSNDLFTSNEFELNEFTTSKYESLYFSNIFDRGVKRTNTFLPLNSSDLDDSIKNIEDRNLLFQLQLMNNPIIEEIKKVYKDFPSFQYLQINSNPLSKRNLRQTYIDTNIGFTNVLKKIRDDFDHDFVRLQYQLNEGKYVEADLIKEIKFNRFVIEITNTPNLLNIFNDILKKALNQSIEYETTIEQHYFKTPKNIILEKCNNKVIEGISFNDLAEVECNRIDSIIQNIETSASTTNLLDEVWKKYPLLESSNSGKTHLEDDLLKNFEVNILSLLVLNDTYAINGLQSTFEEYNYNKVRELINDGNSSFIDILNEFLNKYIAQNHRFIYGKIKEKIGKDLLNADEDLILKEVSNYKISSHGIKIEDIHRKINQDVKGIFIIKKMYDFLKNNLADKNSLEFDIKSKDILEKAKEFVSLSQKLREYFSSIPNNEKELFYFDIGKNFSYGEKSILNLFAQFFEFKLQQRIEQYGWENLNILLDEADLGFHPEWKKKFIYAITTVLSVLFSKENLQIIITTHDPLTLSDIPNCNVAYLKKDGDKTKVLNQNEKPKKSFGANITDLLADSFFIEDGLIGDFAKEKIETTIKWLNDCEIKKSNNKSDFYIEESEKEFHLKVIELIDEKMIHYKLREKYFEIFPEKFEEEEKEKNLKKLAAELGYKIEKQND